MTISINGENYYWTAEAARMAGISKNTLLRWFREGILADVEHRDRRGWRLFSKYDLDRLSAEVKRVEIRNAKNKGGLVHI